jgi:hypothetical protein
MEHLSVKPCSTNTRLLADEYPERLYRPALTATPGLQRPLYVVVCSPRLRKFGPLLAVKAELALHPYSLQAQDSVGGECGRSKHLPNRVKIVKEEAQGVRIVSVRG